GAIVKTKVAFFDGIRELIAGARTTVARGVDLVQVQRAAYGEQVIGELADRLTGEFGRGFSHTNLKLMRLFYLQNQNRIGPTVSDQFNAPAILQSLTGILGPPPPRPFTLSWSHYVFLLGVKDPNERSFYEIEATEQNWTVRHLKRQFDSGLYERLALSRDKEGIRRLAREGQTVAQASDLLKEPLVLGGISHRCSRALTWRRHSSLPRRHSCRRWSATLYHAREQVSIRVSTRQARVPAPPRCYVLIDLKLGKIAHQDLG